MDKPAFMQYVVGYVYACPSLERIILHRFYLLDFSYIMGAVHKKVFSVIKEAFEEDDKLLFTKCKQLHNVTAQQLGVNKKIACPLLQAVS